MATCIALSIFTVACNAPTNDAAAKAAETAKAIVDKPDLAKLKADIQALENTWAVASNTKDMATILAFFADDAVSMEPNKPITVGKAAIQKSIEANFAKQKEGNMIAFETMDVFGDENMLTETGKATTKDATGKVTYTGKYMVLWEKRNGKWQTIRDIYNDDAKEK